MITMPFPNMSDEPIRVSLPEAIQRVLSVLRETSTASIASLSRATGLDRRTVTKVIDVIMEVQSNLQNLELAKLKDGKRYIIRLQERTEQARALFDSVRRRLGRTRKE